MRNPPWVPHLLGQGCPLHPVKEKRCGTSSLLEGLGKSTSPAVGDAVASREPGEVVRRHLCRRTGEGASIQHDVCALTRAVGATSPEGRGKFTPCTSRCTRCCRNCLL